MLATVIDAYSRRAIGWSIADHMRSELVVDALQMAIWRRKPPAGKTICHSDRGVQYLSIRYTERVAEAGGVTSVGSRGDSYDNALVRHEALLDRGGMKGPSRRPVAAGRRKLGAA